MSWSENGSNNPLEAGDTTPPIAAAGLFTPADNQLFRDAVSTSLGCSMSALGFPSSNDLLSRMFGQTRASAGGTGEATATPVANQPMEGATGIGRSIAVGGRQGESSPFNSAGVQPRENSSPAANVQRAADASTFAGTEVARVTDRAIAAGPREPRSFHFSGGGRDMEFQINADGSYAQRDTAPGGIRRLQTGSADGQRRELLIRQRGGAIMATETLNGGEPYVVYTGNSGYGEFQPNTRTTVYPGRREVATLQPGEGERIIRAFSDEVANPRNFTQAQGVRSGVQETFRFGGTGWSTELQINANGTWSTHELSQGPNSSFRQIEQQTANGEPIRQMYVRQAGNQRLLNATQSNGTYIITSGQAGWGDITKPEQGPIAPNSSFTVSPVNGRSARVPELPVQGEQSNRYDAEIDRAIAEFDRTRPARPVQSPTPNRIPSRESRFR